MEVDIKPDDRRQLTERRRREDRRSYPETPDAGFRCPTWREQCVQFFTRYIFLLLGFLFFNLVEGIKPAYWSLAQLNTAFAAYFLVCTALFLHAYRHPIHLRRFYIAMWIDIVMVSVAVLNDPYAIPPSLLVYIMVVLGNGMRYGMRLFAVAMVGKPT